MYKHVRADGRFRGPAADDIITAPIDRFCQLAGIGRSKAYELIADGILDSVLVADRRLIVIDSWRRLIAEAPRPTTSSKSR